MSTPPSLPAGLESILDPNNFTKAPLLDAAARRAFLRPNAKLDNALANSAANKLPPISVSPMSGQHLSILTQLIGAKTVLEIGTLGGYSSIHFAEAGAKVTSIEIDARHRDVALDNVKGLDVEVILGAALDVMPSLFDFGRQFDMVFIDADFDDQVEMFDWAVKLTRVGGCVFLDDVVAAMFKRGEVVEGKGGMKMLAEIGRDERVQAALVPGVATSDVWPGLAVFNGCVIAVVKKH